MAYINIKKNLNHIGPLLKTTTEKESIKLTKIKNKLESNINANSSEYEKFIHMIGEVDLNGEEDNFKISRQRLMNEKVLLVFIWDQYSPFLGEKIDKYSTKLSFLKKKLDIQNTEHWESDRVDDCFSPWEKYIPPRVNTEEKKRDLGKYYHISERNKCHIGFLINMAQCALPIETNTILQYRLENTYNPSETKNKEKTYIADSIIKDTTFRRLETLEKALKSFTMQVLAYMMEKNTPYEMIYIITNPVCSKSNPDVPLLAKLTYSYLGNMFLKGMKLHMAPCIEVVTLNDLCNIDENTYTPGKKMAREMKSLVSIHNA